MGGGKDFLAGGKAEEEVAKMEAQTRFVCMVAPNQVNIRTIVRYCQGLQRCVHRLLTSLYYQPCLSGEIL
jgi:hypothetical protein